MVREGRESDSDGDAAREQASMSRFRSYRAVALFLFRVSRGASACKKKLLLKKKLVSAEKTAPNAHTNHERVDPPSWPKPMKASPCGCDCYRERVKRV